MQHRHLHTLLIGLLTALTFSSAAYAQSGKAPKDRNTQMEDFEPFAAGQAANILNTATNKLPSSGSINAGIFFHYLDRPVPSRINNDPKNALLEKQMKLELGFSVGVAKFAELGLDLPVIAYQVGYKDITGTDKLPVYAIQDLRLHAKFRFINPNREWAHGFGLGMMLTGYFPIPSAFDGKSDFNEFNSFYTNKSQSYAKSIRVEPRLIIDYQHPSTGITVATNVGFQFRPRRFFYSYKTTKEIRWNVGLEAPIPKVTWIRPEVSLFGQYPLLTEQDKKDYVSSYDTANQKGARDGYAIQPSAEFEIGLKFLFSHNMVAQLGGGSSLIPNPAPGTPQFRLFAGLAYSPIGTALDDDGDGLINQDDWCPDEYGPIKNHGCPWGDRDSDGIPDNVDQCPDDVEDIDGYQDDDGCPEPDNDGDGILDEQDQCPNAPGDEAHNGCPVLDRDNDGIPDDKDQCPDQPETVNNYQDDDGCPDEVPAPAKPSKVRLTDKKIEILDKVYFDTGKAKIQSESFDLLDQVADVLNDHPQIEKVRVEGHTDSKGNSRKNKKLSQQRADAVRQYLISKGVDANRLIAKGYGSTQPIASNKTEDGREQNRRVEFTILENKK